MVFPRTIRPIIFYASLFCVTLLTPSPTYGKVILEDGLCIAGRETMLRAETKKGIFRKGGIVVEFFVKGLSIGKNLSGGDGIAYKSFVPQNRGLYRIKVRSREDAVAEGWLLCLHKGESLVLIDVQTLRENPFSTLPKKHSSSVVKRLSKRFSIVYISPDLMPRENIKEWLSKTGYPAAPLMSFAGGEIFSEIAELGLNIRAVVAGAGIGEEAVARGVKTFSFVEIDGAIELEDWLEVEKKV